MTNNICTKVLLRLAHRWGGLGIPDVKVLSPVAYLSTLRGTVRSVVDTLPDRWKVRLHTDSVQGITSESRDFAERGPRFERSLVFSVQNIHSERPFETSFFHVFRSRKK